MAYTYTSAYSAAPAGAAGSSAPLPDLEFPHAMRSLAMATFQELSDTNREGLEDGIPIRRNSAHQWVFKVDETPDAPPSSDPADRERVERERAARVAATTENMRVAIESFARGRPAVCNNKWPFATTKLSEACSSACFSMFVQVDPSVEMKGVSTGEAKFQKFSDYAKKPDSRFEVKAGASVPISEGKTPYAIISDVYIASIASHENTGIGHIGFNVVRDASRGDMAKELYNRTGSQVVSIKLKGDKEDVAVSMIGAPATGKHKEVTASAGCLYRREREIDPWASRMIPFVRRRPGWLHPFSVKLMGGSVRTSLDTVHSAITNGTMVTIDNREAQIGEDDFALVRWIMTSFPFVFHRDNMAVAGVYGPGSTEALMGRPVAPGNEMLRVMDGRQKLVGRAVLVQAIYDMIISRYESLDLFCNMDDLALRAYAHARKGVAKGSMEVLVGMTFRMLDNKKTLMFPKENSPAVADEAVMGVAGKPAVAPSPTETVTASGARIPPPAASMARAPLSSPRDMW